MKKFSKLCFIAITFSIVFAITSHVYAEIGGNIEIVTEKTEYSKGDTIVANVNLCNLNASTGLIAFGAELEYDKNNLEFIGFEGKTGWSTPSYNESNGKFVSDKNAYSGNNELMFQIRFKVKSENAQNVKITIKNIEISNGTFGTFEDVTKNITIKTISSNTNTTTNTTQNTTVQNTIVQNTITNTQNTTNQNSVTNTQNSISQNNTSNSIKNTNVLIKNITSNQSSNDLPYAGSESPNVFIIISMVIFIASAIFYYVKFKNIK